MRRRVLIALLLCVACTSSEKKEPAASTEPSNGAGTTVVQNAKPLSYKVDEVHIDVDDLGADFALLDLKELPPVGEWKTITIRSTDGRDFRGTKPLLLTGVRTMRMVTLPSGAREFRVVEKDESAAGERIRHKMTDAKSVLIHTKSYVPPPVPEVSSELTISCKGSKTVLDAAAVDVVKRTAEPGKGEPKAIWALTDLVAAAKCSTKGGVTLTDAAGEILELSSEQLADKALLHVIKRNRRKLFNYRQWSLADSPKRTVNMRGVQTVEAPK